MIAKEGYGIRRVMGIIRLSIMMLLIPICGAKASEQLDQELITAAYNGDTKAVKLLLDKGAKIEAQDKDGYTALMEATTSGKTDVVKLLLDKGANIEAKANNGKTALTLAALWGRIAVMDMLMGLLEKKERPRNVFALYVDNFGYDQTNELLLRIIKLAKTLRPPPAVPKEVEEIEGKADFFVKNAKTYKDYLSAAYQYGKASLLAPWVPSYYFNQGVVLEKGGDLPNAIKNFERYLLAASDAEDAREVRKRIGGLKAALEKVHILEGKWLDRKVLLSDGPLPYKSEVGNIFLIKLKVELLSGDKINRISIFYGFDYIVDNQIFGSYSYTNCRRTNSLSDECVATYEKQCEVTGEFTESRISFLRHENCVLDKSSNGPRIPRYDDLYDNSDKEVILTR